MSKKFRGVLALLVLFGVSLAPVIASAHTIAYSWPGLNFTSEGTVNITDDALILTDPTQTTYTNSTSTYTGYNAIRQACEDSLNNTAGPFAGAGAW